MSAPLRIAFFVNSFPVLSETFILGQITGLLQLGHQVRIFADTHPEADSPAHEDVTRFKLLEQTTYIDGPPESLVWDLPAFPFFARTWPPGQADSIANWKRVARAVPVMLRCALRTPSLTRQVLSRRLYRYQASSLSSLYRLASLIKHPGPFDVLHAHFGTVGNSYRFARSLFGAPLVVSFHGYDFSTRPRQEGQSMYTDLFATVDRVTVNSRYTTTALQALGCPSAKTQLLPVGLDLERFPYRPRSLQPGETPRLITVARLAEIKGHEFVLRALARLKVGSPRVHYDIVGEGPLRQRLQQLAGELGLESSVTFHGAQTAGQVANLLAQAHLFLLTSVRINGDQEGQGLALQEAQACGLPVVATDHGAFPEGMLDGRSGFLVPERDVEALADRLQWLFEHPSSWPELGRAGRAFVEGRYDIRKLNMELVALYRETIHQIRSSP